MNTYSNGFNGSLLRSFKVQKKAIILQTGCSYGAKIFDFNRIAKLNSLISTSDYITITLLSDAHTLKGVVEGVRLYDVFGQEATPVSRADTPASGGQVRVDVSTLPAGVYFVRIGDKVSKFVKM